MAEQIGLEAKLDLSKFDANLRKFNAGLTKAGDITAHVASNMVSQFDKVGRAIATFGSGAILGGAAAVVGGIGAIGVAAFNVSNEVDKAAAAMAASLDLPIEVAREFAEVAKEVYANNFGASIEEAAAAVTNVRQTMRLMADDPALQRMTEHAFRLKDAFGVEVNESVSAAQTLIENFGITGEEAFDLIAKGYSMGFDRSEDFLDTIGEYSTQFANGGAEVGEFFGILGSGLQGGMLGTDKAADAFKEFRVRIADGSDLTAESLRALGISADEVTAGLSDGTLTAADAFEMVIDGLNKTTDPVKRFQAGVGLLGSQFEDLGEKVVLGLELNSDWVDGFEGTAERLDARYATLGDAFEGVRRKFIIAFTPITDKILELVNEHMPKIINTIGGFATVIEGFFDIIMGNVDDSAAVWEEWRQNLEDVFGPNTGKMIGDIGLAIAAFINALRDGETPLNAFSFAMELAFGETGAQIAGTITGIIDAIGRFIAKVQEIAGPILAAIGNFVEWKDVLIVLGGALLTVVVPAIGALIAAIAPVILTIGGAILAVSLLRTAWESDWLGIQTSTTAAIDAIKTAFTPLTEAIQTNGAAALLEIQAFATGNETSFTNLKTVVDAAKLSFKNLFTTITENIPALQTQLGELVATHFPALNTALDEMKGHWDGVAVAIGAVGAVLAIAQLPAAFAAITLAVQAAGAAIAAALGAINLPLVAIAIAVALVAYAWQENLFNMQGHAETFVAGSKTQWEALKKDLEGVGTAFQTFKTNSQTMWEQLKTDVAAVGTALSPVFNTLKLHIAGLALSFVASFPLMKSTLDTFVSGSKTQWEQLKTDISGLSDTWNTFSDNSKTMWAQLKKDVVAAGTALGPVFNTLKLHVAGLALSFVASFPIMKSTLDTFVSGSQTQWEQLKTDIQGVGTVFKTFQDGSKRQWNELKTETAEAGTAIGTIFGDLRTQAIGFGFNFAVALGLAKSTLDTFVSGSASQWAQLKTDLQGVVTEFNTFRTNSATQFTQLKSEIEAIDWKATGTNIVDFIKRGIDAARGVITTAGQTISTIFSEQIANPTTSWFRRGMDVVTKIRDGVSSMVTRIVTTFKGMIRDAVAAITETNWLQLGKDIVQGLIDGAGKLAGTFIDTLSGMAQDAYDAVTGIFKSQSPSRLMMQLGYWIVRGWIIGMEKQGSALRFAMEQLGLSVARAAGRAGANAAETFVDALGRFNDLGSARIDELRTEFEEVSLLAGQIAALGSSGSLAHTIYSKRSSDLSGVIHAFEVESKLLEQQQNTLSMIRAIEQSGGDVSGLMSGFLVGDQFAIDAESQVRLTTGLMKQLNDNLHRSLLMNVKGFTKQAQAVQAVAEQALSGFGDTAREQAAKLVEAVFNPESSLPGSLQGNREALGQLQRFAATLNTVRNELTFMAKQRFSAESIIEAMTGEFSQLDDFKRRIAGYDEQIEALQARILETGDSSLLAGLRTLDAYRSVATANLRQFLVQSKRAELALEGFGDTARAQINRILSSLFADDTSYEEQLGLMPFFEDALQRLLSISATLANQNRASIGDIIDRATAGFDQVKQFEVTIGDLDEEIDSLQDKIMETGDASLLTRLTGLGLQRERAENELRTFFVQMSRVDGFLRRIKTITGAGEISATRFMEEQIQSIASAIAAPMREIDREMWIRTAEQRVDFLNRFIDQARVVEQLQQSIAGMEGFDGLADEFAKLSDITVPEATRLALMRTVETYINQMKLFRSAQKDIGDALSSPFGGMFQASNLDPLLTKIEDIATGEAERLQLMEQYRQQQEKLVAVSKQQQYLSFLEEQANLLNSLKGLGGDTNQLARLSQIFQGITLGPNASVEDLLTAETRLMQERIRLTEEYLKRQQKILEIEQQQQRVDYVGKQIDMVQKLIALEDEFGYAAVPLESLFRGLTFGTDMPLDHFLNLSGKLVDALLKTSYLALGNERLRPTGPITVPQASSTVPYTPNGRSATVQFNGPVTISNGMDLAQFGHFVDQKINQAMN